MHKDLLRSQFIPVRPLGHSQLEPNCTSGSGQGAPGINLMNLKH